MDKEQWKTIPEFPYYEVSDLGRIFNRKYEQMMRISYTNHGHAKITLTDYWHKRHTRSVAQIVAEAFVLPPNEMCDQVMVLDGDLRNLKASNLVWRPRWYAWKYTRQLKTQQPLHYRNLMVANIKTNVAYDNIVTAGQIEGLLYEDIWRSTYTGTAIYPHGAIFEVIERV